MIILARAAFCFKEAPNPQCADTLVVLRRAAKLVTLINLRVPTYGNRRWEHWIPSPLRSRTWSFGWPSPRKVPKSWRKSPGGCAAAENVELAATQQWLTRSGPKLGFRTLLHRPGCLQICRAFGSVVLEHLVAVQQADKVQEAATAQPQHGTGLKFGFRTFLYR